MRTPGPGQPTYSLSVFHASLRSCDPDEFNRELSSVFSFPVYGSYTFAHLNPVPCTVMESLIINRIIQPAFSNSSHSMNGFFQLSLLSLLFDVCLHILFIAYNSSAAVYTELLIVMDFHDGFHYSI